MWTPKTNAPVLSILALKEALNIEICIETGTAQGDTAFILSGFFHSVATCEISAEFCKIARRRLRHCGGVRVSREDSISFLGREMEILRDERAIFWLDAHYCGGASGPKDCPVLEEIAIIRKGHPDNCILVDDARCFCATAEEREHALSAWARNTKDWPLREEVLAALRYGDHAVGQLGDVLFSVPARIEHCMRPEVDE